MTRTEAPWGWLHHGAAGMAATHLDEEPRGDESQAAVLPVESIVVSVEGKVIQIEEPGQQGKKQQGRSADRTNLSFFLPLIPSCAAAPCTGWCRLPLTGN